MRFRKHPRLAYCTGCDQIFPFMHMLRNHRRTFRCGGEFRIRGEIPLSSENAEMKYKMNKEPKHKARVPGTVRPSRLPGGSGFRTIGKRNIKLADVAE